MLYCHSLIDMLLLLIELDVEFLPQHVAFGLIPMVTVTRH